MVFAAYLYANIILVTSTESVILQVICKYILHFLLLIIKELNSKKLNTKYKVN